MASVTQRSRSGRRFSSFYGEYCGGSTGTRNFGFKPDGIRLTTGWGTCCTRTSKNRTNLDPRMALTQRLQIRQSQALVMTPQLMQAIKLLQLSNLDLVAYVEAELERNPLLDSGAENEGAPPEPNGAASPEGSAANGETWNGGESQESRAPAEERSESPLDDTS